MIKRIVSAVDGSRNSFDAFRNALLIAERANAEINLIFVIDSRKTDIPIIYSSGQIDYAFDHVYIPPDPNLKKFYEKLREDIEGFGKRIIQECKTLASGSGVSVEGSIKEGLPSTVIVEESRSGDLLVLGQKGENAQYERTIIGSTVEDVVRTVCRPVLISPLGVSELSHLLLLYDGSDTSEKALEFTMNSLCNFIEKITVAVIGIERSKQNIIGMLRSYLDSHCYKAEITMEEGNPVETAMNIAGKIGADIMAVGAYGRHKIRDYLLGSTTSHLIRKSHLPTIIVR